MPYKQNYDFIQTMILSFRMCFSCYHSSALVSLAKIFIHVSHERDSAEIGHSSVFFAFVFIVIVYDNLLVRAKIYFLEARELTLWLHQFSFTMPPPYFHEVKLVFANDPRTDTYTGSNIGVFNGKCRSSRFDETYKMFNNR